MANLADEVYDRLGFFARIDDSQDLHKFVQVLTADLNKLNQLVRHTPTYYGWSELFNPNSTDPNILNWVAQLVGVELSSGLSVVDQQNLIKSMGKFHRGTPDYIINSVKHLLTGEQRVSLLERSPNAYSYSVVTYTSETPDSNLVLNKLKETKPAGLKFAYFVSGGQTYDDLTATNKTYDELTQIYPTYDDMSASLP